RGSDPDRPCHLRHCCQDRRGRHAGYPPPSPGKPCRVGEDRAQMHCSEMLPSLKKAVVALREAGVPFILAGGVASWARGGPETDHDLDFMIKPEDAERALETLVEAGMRPERPPEPWLFKAYDDEVLLDLIFSPS